MPSRSGCAMMIRPRACACGCPRATGFRAWAESDIAAFEAAYPLGTKPRLALALLLGTAARIADVVRLGRGHVRDGAIHMVQQKTGAHVMVPLTNAVVEAINAAAPSEHVVFLLNEHGRAFTAHAFSKWFVKQCRRAGLDKGLSAHGLRKAACRRLAEAGCSANEIAAISGHAHRRFGSRKPSFASAMILLASISVIWSARSSNGRATRAISRATP